MSSYGIAIGETESYAVYLKVNTSLPENRFKFTVVRKKDNVDINYSEWCNEDDNKDIMKFAEELNESYNLFWIKDKGLRERARLEKEIKKLEKEVFEIDEERVERNLQIEQIKEILNIK